MEITGKKTTSCPTQDVCETREQKHVLIFNAIGGLESTADAYWEFRNELLGTPDPTGKNSEHPSPSFVDVINGSTDRLISLNERFRNILGELKQFTIL